MTSVSISLIAYTCIAGKAPGKERSQDPQIHAVTKKLNNLHEFHE